jgi:RNA polymerase sigma-70 factor (ECF subfamily)
MFLSSLARLQAAPGSTSEGAELESTLDAHLVQTRGAFDLEVEPARLMDALARAVHASTTASEAEPIALLTHIHAPELFLASACAAGDRRALAFFEATYVPILEAALRRVVRDAAARDELLQQIRHKLFLPQLDGGAPKILDYSGRGDLGNWLRATAVRQALNFVTRGPKEEPLADQLLATIPAGEGDPERLYAKSQYKAELKAAFAEGAESLTPRERNLLRAAFVEGLSIDAIGAMYGTHRSTAARWLTSAKEHLLAEVRKGLVARLKIPAREVDAVLHLVHSGVSITVERYLAAE